MLGLIPLALLAPIRPSVRDFDNELHHARRDAAYSHDLAAGIKNWFRGDLKNGGNRTEQTRVVWAYESNSQPTVTSDDGTFRFKLERIGDTDIWAGTRELKSGDGFKYHINVDGKPMPGGLVEVWQDPPESKPIPGVPQGQLIHMPVWHSQIFADTRREWWIYIPPGLKPDEDAAVMVFQDGQGPKGYVPVIFDNLIAKGDMPKTVGIFISPGTLPGNKSNRSFEYDTLSDQYTRFLLEEILPEVEKKVRLTHDPDRRAISGASSGGICSFTVAWQRPDQFRKVLSWVGSFTDIAHGDSLVAGGHNYPFMIRLSDKKPIRVFLQDGENDLDNLFGNWPMANQQMAKALAFKDYDYKFIFGHGTHNDKMGRAMLPDALRWLWRPLQ
jgi:enterochelin esterase family protein